MPDPTARRLPGIRFEAQPQASQDVLPRMDVAVFVGFAQRCAVGDSPPHGALPASEIYHTPVAVESIEQYAQVFGDDLPLAWDCERAEMTYAYLGPAVRAFFRNGGRRCWVIRVPHEQVDPGSFLDDDLKDVGLERLLTEADAIRYQSATPRDLTGIHAALSLEEATMIAVPDAVHRLWRTEAPLPLATALASPSLEPPEWSNFLDCDATSLPEPELPDLPGDQPDEHGSYVLKWSLTGYHSQDTVFYLQEATRTDWSDAAVIYQGKATELQLLGRSAGDFFYRVRAVAGKSRSDWSQALAVRLPSPAPSRRQLSPSAEYQEESLLAVHRALLRMCAARGDMLAVLALPLHYRAPQAQSFAEQLLSQPDARRLGSYGALYHPWLTDRDNRQPSGGSADLHTIPPDGAVCGMLAKRSLERGVWVAPANERIANPVALTPRVAPSDHACLQQAQINLIRQEPRGFVALSADTLSADSDLRPINVRRLLMLLRRLALRVGNRYVFEPNDGSFRRGAAQAFEQLLAQMYAAGAFAGATAASAYRVVVDDTLNTRQSVDQGRFIVELRVAPSLPLTFLTVRLVQTGDRITVTEGG